MEKGWYLNMPEEKSFKCAYKHCLHHGENVNPSESVVISNKHYHWDCAVIKNEIKECVDLYMECIEDKTQFPIAVRLAEQHCGVRLISPSS